MPDSELGTADTENAQGTKQTNSCFTGLRPLKVRQQGKSRKGRKTKIMSESDRNYEGNLSV